MSSVLHWHEAFRLYSITPLLYFAIISVNNYDNDDDNYHDDNDNELTMG